MIRIRKASERGYADHGWLETHHTFSFANYMDPEHMGFRSLRVINDDVVAPGEGFPTHPHRDMEILTYVVSGSLEHRDSMGTGSVVRPGELQRMSAGTGVRHSEFNASEEEPLRLLQIWILPRTAGGPPSYEQRPFPIEEQPGKLHLLASPEGRDGSVSLNQDVVLHAGRFEPGDRTRFELAPGRHAWVQIVRGEVEVSGRTLSAGDGAALSDERHLELVAREDSEVLMFDLA